MPWFGLLPFTVAIDPDQGIEVKSFFGSKISIVVFWNRSPAGAPATTLAYCDGFLIGSILPEDDLDGAQ